MELSPTIRMVLVEFAKKLHGAARRRYMAETCERLSLSHRQANLQLGWNRETLRKATHERTSGITCDTIASPGRKPAEYHLPRLLDDIRDLVEETSQLDSTFRTTRLYRRITASEVRRQLIERKGYTDEQLPTVQTITTKLNGLGLRCNKAVVNSERLG